MVRAACGIYNINDVMAAAEVVRQTQEDDNTAIITRLSDIDWSSVDAITIFAGTNDWYNANSIGDADSNNPNKTLGAINLIISEFLATYPNIKIYWFTPIVRWVSGFNVSTNPLTIDDSKFSDNYIVEGNGTLKQTVANITQEVTNNHIPVCDMYNNFGWNKYNCKVYFSGTDGTHPRTKAGVMYLAHKILNFLQSNITF
jgi:lysophospholipase L1-like esterase